MEQVDCGFGNADCGMFKYFWASFLYFQFEIRDRQSEM